MESKSIDHYRLKKDLSEFLAGTYPTWECNTAVRSQKGKPDTVCFAPMESSLHWGRQKSVMVAYDYSHERFVGFGRYVCDMRLVFYLGVPDTCCHDALKLVEELRIEKVTEITASG